MTSIDAINVPAALERDEMIRKKLIGGASLALAAIIPFRAEAGTLRGSPSSMEQQHEIAVEEDLTFMRKASQVEHLVDSGALVPVAGNEDFSLSKVSFPYARPEVLLFIERLAAQYRADNGAKLVVTSLTRPAETQPRNAHKLSVHPAGMAVDFRVPSTAKGREWLENALLGLENAGVLDVTRERHPPHYHVAVFPVEYAAYAAARPKVQEAEVKAAPPAAVVAEAPAPVLTSVEDKAANQSFSLVIASLITLALVSVVPAIAKKAVKNS